MDTAWQVIIGSAIGGALISVYQLYRAYIKESKEQNENQKLAKWSVIFGLSGIILVFLGSIIGLVLGIISVRKYRYKALSKIGIALSVLSAIPWLLVIMFGQ
jgi:hypothetical protein